MAPTVLDPDNQPIHSSSVAFQSRKRSHLYYARHRDAIRAHRSIQGYQNLQLAPNQLVHYHLQGSTYSPTPSPFMNTL